MNATWRTYLDDLVHRMNSEEKQRFFRDVGVSRTTVQRWRSGEDSPRAGNLERLLAVLPNAQRMQFLVLLQDDPRVWALLPEETRDLLAQMPPDSIPSEVYASILRAGRNAPDRFWELCKIILRHAIVQLDPHNTGLEIVVARCMPPRPDGKIRSLRADLAMGTPPWRADLHHEECFLGAESLAGSAVSSQHGEMVPDLLDASALLPVHPMEHERSAAAFPVMREGSIAGALIVSSVQAGYFTPQRLVLIEAYADLICLAFYDRDFYPISLIDLALMPSWMEQGPYFDTFRRRVEDEYRQSLQGRGPELAHIEQAMLEHLEEELIRLAASSGETVHS
jgi:transcriptional regulator with XRE-family HTH domain